ncbi:putative F-box domain-containing protein [Medicago truncatula]|uniref:Putative F-box domain-containing protein n=1 Tax=Medicago truncatula TaxID=3880 RepID=A0A396GHV7_MEDTR|nr:putative F-box domain-containing protein [Medicago truncatula]
MVLGSEGAVYSQSLNEKQQLTETLTSPSLPTLPFDLIPEILSRLPVKFLLQFRCVCKSLNSLISDHKFANKHIRVSTTTLVHTLTYSTPFSRT